MMRRSSNSTLYIEESDSPVEGLEEGTLAIRTQNTNINDIWKRPAKRTVKTPQNEIHIQFEIPFARVMPLDTEENISIKKYVVYDVSICQSSESDTATDSGTGNNLINPTSIERRYTHFLHLYNNLKRDHNNIMNRVTFPKKALLGNFSTILIAERSTAFETFLDFVISKSILLESPYFLQFLQDIELKRACQLLDERRNEQAVPILENTFLILNKIFTDRSKPVLLVLCRLVAACTTSPVPHPSAERWAELALRRYDSVSDADLLILYIPLLQTCTYLWWQRGRDNTFLEERLKSMEQRGINTKNGKTLTQVIHALDPRTETN